MKYLGGKAKIARRLVEFMQPYINRATAYYEPFLGGCNVLPHVRHAKRYGSDFNAALVALYRAVYLEGWTPPDEVSRETHAWAKRLNDATDPLTGFARVACSFGGDYCGGYASDKEGVRNYAKEGKRALLKNLDAMCGVSLTHQSYADINPTPGSVIYCDPPYAGTTGYGAVGEFDSNAFWQWAREVSETCVVFVSEYQAPEDFYVIWEIEKRHSIDNRRTGEIRNERLFVHGENFLFPRLRMPA